jgi:uncharacterized lipoprotein YmbA
MMMNRRYSLLAGAVVLTVMIISGCAGTSPPVTFYTLDRNASISQSSPAGTACGGKAIAVGPVNWPRYLDQPRIVTRTGPNTLGFDEFHRWSGSLQDEFKRALIKNLSGLLPASIIMDFRQTLRHTPDYRVELGVKQFDGQLGGETILDAVWVIVVQKTGKALELHGSTITKQIPGLDYEALASASSLAVAELGREIAAELLKACSAAGQ